MTSRARRVPACVCLLAGALGAGLLVGACGGQPGGVLGGITRRSSSGRGAGECLAERAGSRAPTAAVSGEACQRGEFAACGQECQDDVGDGCVRMAALVEAQLPDDPRAFALYERGCVLGNAGACTSYGVGIVTRKPGASGDAQCAGQLFVIACSARDARGCGMLGVALADGHGLPKDPSKARAVLEQACGELAGFACNSLGYLLEQGRLGPPDLAAAGAAYDRGCSSGHAKSCEDAQRLRGSPIPR
ncbi:MAG: sel1 repeat family protein [Polyangiaceae bacterium]|nr:sel1 repeat family protein [Polyangiaceae bacterium]